MHDFVVTIRWNNSMVLVNESEGNVMLCATAHGWTTAESNLTVLLSYSGTARGSCGRYDNCF